MSCWCKPARSASPAPEPRAAALFGGCRLQPARQIPVPSGSIHSCRRVRLGSGGFPSPLSRPGSVAWLRPVFCPALFSAPPVRRGGEADCGCPHGSEGSARVGPRYRDVTCGFLGSPTSPAVSRSQPVQTAGDPPPARFDPALHRVRPVPAPAGASVIPQCWQLRCRRRPAPVRVPARAGLPLSHAGGGSHGPGRQGRTRAHGSAHPRAAAASPATLTHSMHSDMFIFFGGGKGSSRHAGRPSSPRRSHAGRPAG